MRILLLLLIVGAVAIAVGLIVVIDPGPRPDHATNSTSVPPGEVGSTHLDLNPEALAEPLPLSVSDLELSRDALGDWDDSKAVSVEDEVLSGPALWATKYKDATYGQLIDSMRELMATLDSSTSGYYQECFDSGRFESYLLEPDKDGGYSLGFLQDDLLRRTEFTPDGQVRTVALPKEQYAEAYATRDEISWLEDQAFLLGRKLPSVLPK